MKSINYLFFSNYGNSLIYVILALTSTVLCSPSCGLYGAPPCQFLPAPPGQTPSCARPGKTYCEHINNYPTYLIKHLVHKWGYEAKNLIVDETWDEFASLSWHETSHFYDPAFIFPHHPYGDNGGGGDGNRDFNGYKYSTPSGATTSNGGRTAAYSSDNLIIKSTETPTFLLYNSAAQRANAHNNQLGSYGNSNKVTPNNPALWLKRIVRELSERAEKQFHAADAAQKTTSAASLKRHTRDVSLNMDLLDIVGVDSSASTKRIKRQSAGRSSLCQTTSQYVTPQAALNSKGNWMFVVNEMNTARQMVKAELCTSSTCTNLCQLPNGYNSRCEQKFVQKRLIALQANGQNLYTDTFWFPSCCVCTISAT